MAIAVLFGLGNLIASLALGPETRGTEMVPELTVA
jgi:hypothetical protein